MRTIKEEYRIGIDLSNFPEQLGCGVFVNKKRVEAVNKLTTDQLAAAVCALDSLRFEVQKEFHKRIGCLPTEGWFAGGEA